MNKVGFFEIQSFNPAREMSFYKALFGWEFKRDETVPFELYFIKTGNIEGALLARPAKVPPKEHGTNAYVCSIEVDNFDETAEKVIELGGIVALPKFAVPNRCWQGYFVDQDNNTFGIFEMDENAK